MNGTDQTDGPSLPWEPARLRFDFGSGTVPVLERHGRWYVRFTDLVAFVGGDYERLLKHTESRNALEVHLLKDSDGSLLFQHDAILCWMLGLETDAIADEHRERQTCLVLNFIGSAESRRVSEWVLEDIVADDTDPPHPE